MNLIEQLGGYKKAKEIAFDPLHQQMTHVSNDGRHWVNEEFSHIPEIQEQIPTMIRIKDIRKALHNIFEVGDKVIGSKLFDDRIFEFQYYLPELSMAVISKDGAAIGLNQLRHATPEEIKAGKRLEIVK